MPAKIVFVVVVGGGAARIRGIKVDDIMEKKRYENKTQYYANGKAKWVTLEKKRKEKRHEISARDLPNNTIRSLISGRVIFWKKSWGKEELDQISTSSFMWQAEEEEERGLRLRIDVKFC